MYIIYQTTNIVNNKIYIGVHNGLHQDYLGSGTLITKAIRKYGKKAFTRQIIDTAQSLEEAYEKEKAIVNEEFIKRADTYNIRIGGLGGAPMSDSTKEIVSRKAKDRLSDPKKNGMYGKNHSEESKLRMSKSTKGFRHSVETKNKIKASSTGRYHSEQTKQKCSVNNANHWNGKRLSKAHKEAISKSQIGQALVRTEKTCPHCGKTGKGPNMSRYHFDNCSSYQE